MIKSKHLILFLIIVYTSTFSQINGGVISYSISIVKDTSLVNKRISYLIDKAITGANQVELKLDFNSTKSKFYSVDKIENQNVKMAKALCSCNNIVFTDLENQVSKYNTKASSRGVVEENEFMVYASDENNWQITKEKKVIDNLVSYKAIKAVKYNNSKGEHMKNIIAWYTPEIPYSFGPNGYFGLPGMILELQDKNVHFYATKIKLTKKSPFIEIPTVGKLISTRDYQLLLKERIEGFIDED